jgi:hypothetical protein
VSGTFATSVGQPLSNHPREDASELRATSNDVNCACDSPRFVDREESAQDEGKHAINVFGHLCFAERLVHDEVVVVQRACEGIDDPASW